MRPTFKSALNLVLVAAFCVNPMSPALAQPPTLPRTEAAVAEAKEFQQLIRSSEHLPAGQPRGSFAPDRFLLLEQQVHLKTRVGRAFSFFSTPVERELEEHRYRLDQARKIHIKITDLIGSSPTHKNACMGLSERNEFTSESIFKNVVRHIDSGRASKDIPLFVWNSKDKPQELACLEERVRQLIQQWNYKISDLFQIRENITEVPNITHAPLTELRRYYNWWQTSIAVKSFNDNDVLEHLNLRRTADGHSTDDGNSYVCPNSDLCKFDLKAGQDTLHSFHLPTRAITTFGPYVVFVHNQSYDEQTGVQYLSFLDLSFYGPSIGRTDIPVFRLPVASSQAITSLGVKNKKLMLNNKATVAIEAFMAASELQQAAFNITANLVDPQDIADVIPYIESLQTYFEKIMQAQIQEASDAPEASKRAKVQLLELSENIGKQIQQNKKLTEFAGKANNQLSPEEVAQLSTELRQLIEPYSKGVETAKTVNDRMSAVAQRFSASRGMKARLEAFFSRILSPVPNASLKVKRALVYVGAFRNQERGKFMDFLLDRPYLSSFLMAASMMSAASPEAFLELLRGSLALGNGIFDYSKFALLGLGEAFVKGTIATFSPVADLGTGFYKQYLAGDNLSKTLIGLGAFVPFIMSLYFIPHMIFNLHKIYLDWRKPSWKGFVQNQQQFVSEYYARLAEDEAKRRHLNEKEKAEAAVTFTAEEELEIRQFIEMRKTESPAYRTPGFLGRSWRAFGSSMAKLKSKIGMGKLKSETWSALTSVAFSYPAMELTLGRWVKFWNWFSGTRYTTVGFLTLRDVGLKYNFPIFIRPKPISAAVRMTFPDFFTTVVAKGGALKDANGKAIGHEVSVPTVLNGGTRSWEIRDMIWLKETIFGKPSSVQAVENEVVRELSLSQLKGLTEAFEKEIVAVEREVFQVAFQAALRRLPDFLTDKKELINLFIHSPMKTAFEKRIRAFPVEVRTFLRLYFEEVYAATMSDYLRREIVRFEHSRAENSTPKEIMDSLSLAGLKAKLLELRKEARSTDAFHFNSREASGLAHKHGLDQAIYDRVAKQARKGELSLHNWIVNRKYNLIADMDPKQNGSMERYATVQERLKSPNALSRAVRAEISKLLITFPLDLGFKLVLSAGVFEGAFKPIQDQMFSDNSIFYLSRDSFYMLTAAGFTMSMMADAWVKIQQDARQDDMGDFGQIPQGQDAAGSFFRWYMKQFNAKNNSLLGNWAFSNKISFWNLPAALVNIGLFSYMFSGRVDLSYLLAGYVVAFATPVSAFYFKVDQAFERAVDYAARGIKDEKWMAHPEIQELIAKERQYYRNRFQWLNDIYGNIQGNWLQNVEVIPTSQGTRGFVRSLLGGYLVEEALVEKLLRPIGNAAQTVPVAGSIVKRITDACEYLLTNGNTDLRLKK